MYKTAAPVIYGTIGRSSVRFALFLSRSHVKCPALANVLATKMKRIPFIPVKSPRAVKSLMSAPPNCPRKRKSYGCPDQTVKRASLRLRYHSEPAHKQHQEKLVRHNHIFYIGN